MVSLTGSHTEHPNIMVPVMIAASAECQLLPTIQASWTDWMHAMLSFLRKQ